MTRTEAYFETAHNLAIRMKGMEKDGWAVRDFKQVGPVRLSDRADWIVVYERGNK